jgi:predicted outer membrane repeat protein
VVILAVLLITLLMVSTVNATDIVANSTLDDSKVQESHKQTLSAESEDIGSTGEKEVMYSDVEKTSNLEFGDNQDTSKTQKTVKTTAKNKNNILSENSPKVVDVYNYTQLLDLFSYPDKPGITQKNLIINLLGNNEDYKITQTLKLRNGHSSISNLTTLTINGNNKIIDGCGEYEFIELGDNDAPLNLTLSNIIIKNCKDSMGGAIYIGDNTYANLTINDCVFENNHAEYAGAINFGGSSLKVINSNFTSNSATIRGGAIYANSNLTLSESNIINNSASDGGAIYIYNSGNNEQNVNITNNIFKDNFVTSNDGWVVHLNNATIIQNNLFVNNTDNNRDMLFNMLGKLVNNNTYIDNYLEDSWKDIKQPIIMFVNQETTLDLLKLRDVYNDTIVNGTIYCYLGGLEKAFASFNVNDGSVKLKFDESKLKLGLNNIKLKYISLSKHYQNLNGTLQINLMSKTVTINVTKVWDDNNNPNRPNSVTIVLGNDVGVVDTISLSSNNNWAYSFTNLPKYKTDGNLINYNVDEPNVPEGYTKSILNNDNVFTITNTNKPEMVDYTVNIIWEGKGSRPNTLKLQLYANGQAQGKQVNLKTDTNTKYVFENLPKYNNGELIKYTANLVEMPKGYKESTNESQYGILIKLKKSKNKNTLKWAWKLVKISYKHQNTHANKKIKYTKGNKKIKGLIKSFKTNYKSVKHAKYKHKSYKYNNNYKKAVTYKYRLYIYLYSEFMNGSMSYNDFEAILKVNNIKITKSNWKNGVIIVDYDDISDVPDIITLHDKKGRVPNSSSKVNKTKAKNSDNVVDSSEIASSKTKDTKSKLDNTKSNNAKGVVDSGEVEVDTE